MYGTTPFSRGIAVHNMVNFCENWYTIKLSTTTKHFQQTSEAYMKWNEMKWNYKQRRLEIPLRNNTVSERAVLWARPYGGLRLLDLCRPDPPNSCLPMCPTSIPCSSSLVTSRYVVGVEGRGLSFFSCRCCFLLFAFLFFDVGWGCF